MVSLKVFNISSHKIEQNIYSLASVGPSSGIYMEKNTIEQKISKVYKFHLFLDHRVLSLVRLSVCYTL